MTVQDSCLIEILQMRKVASIKPVLPKLLVLYFYATFRLFFLADVAQK